jgi:hypothetical protein
MLLQPEIKPLWRDKRGPLLIVCFTNHALNQFMNLIKTDTKKMVRIGGKCEDPEL